MNDIIHKAMEANLRKVLTDHWLAEIHCDHENKTDQARCSCSRVNLPVKNSIGEAASTWVEHVIDCFQKASAYTALQAEIAKPAEVEFTSEDIEVAIDTMEELYDGCVFTGDFEGYAERCGDAAKILTALSSRAKRGG